MNVLVLLGPNLDLVGSRPGEARAPNSASLQKELQDRATALKSKLRIVQSNHEGTLVDAVSQARNWADGVVVDPGPLAHGGWSLREALWALGRPVVEAQLGEGAPGEPRRAESIFRAICVRSIFGGTDAWLRGLEHLCATQGRESESASQPRAHVHPERSPGGAKSKGQSAREPHDSPSHSAVHGAARPADPSTPLRYAQGERGQHRGATSPTGQARGEREETIGRRAPPPEPAHAAGKSIGRKHEPNVLASSGPAARAGAGDLRAQTLAKIHERLSGRISASELSGWAKSRWLELSEGGGTDGTVADALQRLMLAHMPTVALTDEQLLEMATELAA